MARGGLGRFWRDSAGVAAIEFALLAPVMLFMLLGALDVSGALQERLSMGHVLRVGAQAAMTVTPGPAATMQARIDTAVKPVMQAVITNTPALAGSVATADLCQCPVTLTQAAPCAALCSGAAAGSVHIVLGLDRTRHSLLLADFNLSLDLAVEIK